MRQRAKPRRRARLEAHPKPILGAMLQRLRKAALKGDANGARRPSLQAPLVSSRTRSRLKLLPSRQKRAHSHSETGRRVPLRVSAHRRTQSRSLEAKHRHGNALTIAALTDSPASILEVRVNRALAQIALTVSEEFPKRRAAGRILAPTDCLRSRQRT